MKCCQHELLDVSQRVNFLWLICIFAAQCSNLCQHMKDTHINTLLKGYSEGGWCETLPQTEPDCCHGCSSVEERQWGKRDQFLFHLTKGCISLSNKWDFQTDIQQKSWKVIQIHTNVTSHILLLLEYKTYPWYKKSWT